MELRGALKGEAEEVPACNNRLYRFQYCFVDLVARELSMLIFPPHNVPVETSNFLQNSARSNYIVRPKIRRKLHI
jgi:hypothetical protein